MYGTKANRILRRLQLFPGLTPGLQAPVELTDGDGALEELVTCFSLHQPHSWVIHLETSMNKTEPKRSAYFGSYRSFPVLTTPGLHRTYLARIQYNGAQLAALDKAIVLVELTDGAQELKRSSSLVSASINQTCRLSTSHTRISLEKFVLWAKTEWRKECIAVARLPHEIWPIRRRYPTSTSEPLTVILG